MYGVLVHGGDGPCKSANVHMKATGVSITFDHFMMSPFWCGC
jgi:hypothetical protein